MAEPKYILSVALSAHEHRQLQKLAQRSRMSMTHVVRLALAKQRQDVKDDCFALTPTGELQALLTEEGEPR